VNDFLVFNLDDRAEAIVVLHVGREDGPMDFILDDHDTTVVRLVGNQLVGGLKLDIVAIAPELSHQIGAPSDNARPTGDVVENLIDDVVSDDVEEVLAINDVAQPFEPD
jgi:hypothetical protein